MAEKRINAALDSIPKSSGSALRNYTIPTLENIREAMRNIITDSYLQGSNDNSSAIKNSNCSRP